ncbi:PAS domain-containing protein [Haloarcula sp. 1CSR25-25]|uniref:PAS domain-containing protein n=1 Tax=Haloarcula sp. 1CSR25-25 TaxID=2862545 RepID=UPI002894388D|nr:PAS domain-containing protein [Haloarcula sp. 1CSR25-25]MDT3435100.1 PAS domain-containing protein [Haloarcula sp. 1CSR25-25]
MADTYATAESIHVLQVGDAPLLDGAVGDPDTPEPDSLTVTTTERADSALDRFEANAADAIVTADELPDRSIWEFVDAVRERDDDVPILLLTESASVASDAVSRGVTDAFSRGAHAGGGDLLENRIRLLVEGRRATRTAVRTRQRLTELAEQSSELLWVFSGDWTEIQFVNSAYERLYGRSVDSLQANPAEFMTAIHPTDQDRVIQAMQRVSAGESVDLEFRITRPDDEQRWIRAEAKPVIEDGTVTRIVGASRDITERKRRESRFDSVERGHASIGQHTEDRLTLARNGEATLYTEPVPLQTVVEQCWQTVETGDATLEIQTAAVVRADPSRLRQLFENLIRNSVEHGQAPRTERRADTGEQHRTTPLSQSQGTAADLTLTVGELDDGFYVADDGAESPTDEGETVFEGGSGHGVRLRIVAAIAEAHGWSMTATESDDGGTRFGVTGVEFGSA